jgi:hypothetical protein
MDESQEIFDILSQPTEIKTIGENKTGFQELEPETVEPIPGTGSNSTSEPEPEQPVNFAEEAGMYICLFDNIVLCGLGKVFYEKRYTSKFFESKEKRDEYEQVSHMPPASLKQEQRDMAATYREYKNTLDKALEKLPLTDNEKQSIQVPLEKVLAKHGGTLPPEMALLLGVGSVILSRIAL